MKHFTKNVFSVNQVDDYPTLKCVFKCMIKDGDLLCHYQLWDNATSGIKC